MKLSAKQKRIYLKLIEELNELSLELLHSVNKTNKENLDKITEEIKDVLYWIDKFKQIND
tara:strand:+ start:287 stop:466 length:180 start_codon:yes stop_codon:yes gene_type:complete